MKKLQYSKQSFCYKETTHCQIMADVYQSKHNCNGKAFLYFHGGGFVMGNRELGLQAALRDALLDVGFTVISADYRLAPENKMQHIVSDARAAFEWVCTYAKQWNVSSDKIVVAGGSAGGFLALSCGFGMVKLPQKIVAISAPTGFFAYDIPLGDLSRRNIDSPYNMVGKCISYADYEQRSKLFDYLLEEQLLFFELFGFDPSVEKEKLPAFRIDSNFHTDYPPVLLLHGADDTQVDMSEAEALIAFFKEKKHTHRFLTYATGHSSTLLQQNKESIAEIVAFSSHI
ncbi:MAG: alpha/beta hydrolase [Flavobacteriaceae bacterium]|nr:alpha/beta hydrolase [Flavobacteriaceae bacterium]